ncbi:chromosome partition protein MukB [Vibrio sp. V27_P1S3P104]|uniref:chromosome partition protein MukB n=1 Tax=unclassified Vibrio TaxID=2614977 RepID=UPI001372CB15|nr:MULTISPECIES: chromosome partition protein MukB [unclassified Vibrio]NAW68436.1 chromosome partition protein MukB [Vibrio sp. V28_P6S34P95]NAX04821.1 chromosome partition protein MukB [Vibrio sp. V30_P3S12P165]NAX33466.1 chromosome partition protein MukB [Vibrio sp. V29_P1S30P107]NAX36955.1 chromosome partition protein MukB [Vibrio sp. V27_P1S3P104]NAX41650.1 chromosome partition protein MukB [Vibrio sp. V26_P1S5P106]
MIERGKYQSLTMINWNGFFARTFDIDNLVTTLSGGNGAGKSTTMAAFITALIPDQSLLHFRNTTEAGSSQASRDKGLYGKLQPGACYAALDVVNSRHQRFLFAVKLQQVAGRDKKVDIKPFVIQGLPSHIKPTDILVESVSDHHARVRQLNEVKEALSRIEGAHFKPFASIVDYHSQMFESGVVPKKLRNSSDRSKFYRLIEASLYGGISSAITRSLRDYLLPQNGGVKKAFQDMESALRENRMTLEAIKNTQADRDLFKHLIAESTQYVAADYMRHANERRINVEQTLSLRQELFTARETLIEQNQLLNRVHEELEMLAEQESALEQDYQGASDHLQLMQNALRQQEKIARYQEDLEELSIRLEEQLMVVEEAQERVMLAEEQATMAEEEVDSLKTQLADYQQALDVQQTRALQYQQALQALDKARQQLNDPTLSAEVAHARISELNAQQEQKTSELLSVKHKLDMSSAAAEQFERALSLVKSVVGDVDRSQAAEHAKTILRQAQDAQQVVQNEQSWLEQQRDLHHRIEQQNLVQQQVNDYYKHHQVLLSEEDSLELERERHQALLESLEQSQETLREQRSQQRRLEQELHSDIARCESIAPAWIQANDALAILREQSGAELNDRQSVMREMQSLLEREKVQSLEKDKLAQRRALLDSEIERLASPGGSNDPRLKGLADTLGGVLLSEIYDDITLEDAPYFSAMYGPARHAIVVSDLSGIKEKLVELDDCPEDLYLIEGDIDAFDDSSIDVEELAGAVCVQLNDRQMRYSRFPEIPLFGRAAREQRLEQLRLEREEIVEVHAKSAFDSQKLQRLYSSFNLFVAEHLQCAFEDDPEQALLMAREKRNQVLRQLTELENQELQQRSQRQLSKQALSTLDSIAPNWRLLAENTLQERLTVLNDKLEHLSQAKVFLAQHRQTVEQLQALASALELDPEQFDALEQQYQQADQVLQSLKSQIFALSDLYERRQHFSYSDSVHLLSQSSELSEQLKGKLIQAESIRNRRRDELKQAQTQLSQYHQVLASLKSSHQAKLETVQEFKQELQEFGVQADESALSRALQRRDDLHERLHSSRGRRSEYERTITSTEMEMKSLVKRLKKLEKEYRDLRTLVVNAKAGWCSVLRLARENDVERRLHKRELAYLSASELRSMSDKSLGALRLAVANNEELRDALRLSEDNAHPERKVLFYIAVYQHLRERIRQDIIRTDDPVEAIEEMEVELARLTEELTQRENRLAISSDSVASIIRKTIQREQNRIRMLNQGLSNIAFGQVKGVRLNVKVRESHEILLSGLAEQQTQHKDLFESTRYTFSEAMAKLFQRVNPHIDMGQRSPQVLGEELLDYRNYLELSVEVNRGSDGWLQAESGALSTGEAIGTGQSILLMVIQSWEEESRRLRSKDIVPCRLLFLDEAARLDAKSIATLFELCERLDMQLLIAAPENISPEKGTTYKLVRKVFKDHEHVHVVGLRGFANQEQVKSEAQQLAEALN